MDLHCNTVVWMFGVKFTFYNLCEQQARIERIFTDDLPAPLPTQYAYVRGVRVDIMANGELLADLPDRTGIEMDFPFFNAPLDKFTLLYWDDPDGDGKGEWVEVTQTLSRSELIKTLSIKAPDELYRLSTANGDMFYPGLTTHKIGIFVLVKK